MLGGGRVSATGGPASENNDQASGNGSLTWERSSQQRATQGGLGLRPEVGEGSSWNWFSVRHVAALSLRCSAMHVMD